MTAPLEGPLKGLTSQRPLAGDELLALVEGLSRPTALIELGLMVGSLVLAWAVVRLMRGSDETRSSWFGRRIVDGLLFPPLALLFVLLAKWALMRGWPGVVPIAVFRLVVPLLLSLVVIRLVGHALRSAFPDSAFARRFERQLSWVAWGAVVLWITGLLPLLLTELDQLTWKIGSAQVSARNLLEGVLTAGVVLVGALWLSSALEAQLLKNAGTQIGVRKMAANALRALFLFIGLMLALEAAGIDLTALGVLGGALGVGIGFGLQKLAANYVSGFVILAERSMRIGDLVKVDNFEGRITDISTRYTVIRAGNGREAIVPNEMMITQRVENSSLADPQVQINTVVQVAYGTDLDALFPRLIEVISAVPRVIADPPPAVQLSNFAADGLELTISFWIADPHNGQGNVRSTVNLNILRTLNEAGIEIPFPQRVVHRLPPEGGEAPPPAPASDAVPAAGRPPLASHG